MRFSGIKQILQKNLPKPLNELLLMLKYQIKKIPDYDIYLSHLSNKKGIEIGGPSPLFKITLPVYKVVASLDSVNFSNNTVWEGAIQTGQSFNYFKNKNGFQFISEATNLDQIKSKTYDFLLSSNCLEHIANPLKALEDWKRVLKDDGFILLVLPNKESNFDHKRPVTVFEHLLDDCNNKVTEHDLTHLDEILTLIDLSMVSPAETLEEFKFRSLDNFNNRMLHHHIFDIPLIKKILEHSNFEVITTCTTKTDLYALAKLNK